MAVPQVPVPPLIGGQTGRAIGIAAVIALALWPLAYAAGFFPWLGYAWLSRSSIGVGPGHFVVGEDRAGSTFGLSTFLFFKGQTIVVSYEADIRRGCLWLQVWNMLHHGPGESSVYTCVPASGKGEWTVTVSQTGLYDIIVHPSVVRGAGPGWRMSYTAWWGARW